MRKTLRDLGIFALLIAAIVVILPRTTIPAVVHSAKVVAAGRPYCIDIPREPDHLWYVPAQHISDLGALRMFAHLDQHRMYSVFHAVLFVGESDNIERYNWSYKEMKFVRIEGQGHWPLTEISECTRRTDFIEHLSGKP